MTRERRNVLLGSGVAIVLASPVAIRSDAPVLAELGVMAMGSAVVIALAILRTTERE